MAPSIRSGAFTAAAFFVAAAVLVAVLVPGRVHPVRQGHDAGFIYGYLPSMARGDLDFSDDAFPFDVSMPHTQEGYTHNAFPIGPALLWSPAFAGAHAVAHAVSEFGGSSVPTDGRSWPYDVLVGFGALVVGVVGVIAVAAAARSVASTRAATAAAVLMWLAGPTLYYTHVEPMVTHAAGFTTVAVLLAAWMKWRTDAARNLWHVALLGLLVGLAALCRWQNVLLALGPAIDVVSGRFGADRRRLANIGLFAGGAALAFAPQMVVWNTLYGSPVRPPRGETSGAYLGLGDLHLLDVLFSWRHGLYSWHPVLAVGTVGLAVLARRQRVVAAALLGSLVLAVIVNASVLDWWAGASFGARRFDGLWPAFAIGLAVVADRLPWRAVLAGGGVFLAANWMLLAAFTTERVSRIERVTPTELLDALGRTSFAPGAGDWTNHKVAWVLGLVVAAAVTAVIGGRRRGGWSPMPRRVLVRVTAAAASALLVVTGALVVVGRKPGRYDAHVFEAGYFVPQAVRPARTDRVVGPSDDVWTLVWSFPGFLPPGRYVAVLDQARAEVGTAATVVVRIDGRTVISTTVSERPTSTAGEPFRMHRGFLRLDVRVVQGVARVAAVRLLPAP